jgi:hypothetical protein
VIGAVVAKRQTRAVMGANVGVPMVDADPIDRPGGSEPMTAAARVVELPGGKKISAADDQDGGPKSPLP